MFESMIVKTIKAEEAEWESPQYIHLKKDDEEDKFDTYKLLKGADNALHKFIDIKPSTSKEVYKKSESTWKSLRDIQLSKAEDEGDPRKNFSLTKDTVLYLVDDYKNLVDVFDAYSEDAINEFEEKLSKFTLDITTMEKTKKFFSDSKNGLVKLICYDKQNDPTKEDYTPIVMIEFSNEKSKYLVYTGILIYEVFTFIPGVSCYMQADRLSDFIKNLEISDTLNFAKDNAEQLYESYKTFIDNPVEISARELIRILKNLGYKLELKTDDQLEPIQNITDETSNVKIQDFFNTFKFTTGETAFDILSLSELKKIFRYNKLTLLEVLAILSKEYLTFEGSKITVEALGSIVYNLFDKQNDKRQAESIKDEIKK